MGTTAGLPPALRDLPSGGGLLGWVVLLAASGAVLVLVPVRRRGTRAATAAVSFAALVLVADTCGPTTSFYWVHGDHLGTPLAVTSNPPPPAAEKVVWRATYAPFGLATVNQDPDGDAIAFALDVRFPGQMFDAESGLHYNYFREYDPATGRYLEADPIGQIGGTNLYPYVRGHPVQRTDRLALFDLSTSFGDFVAEAYLGFYDLQRNRKELVDAKNGRADKYFHCKGHCEACGEGPGGDFLSEIASPAKEVSDFVDKLVDGEISSVGDAVEAMADFAADIKANEAGQEASKQGSHCAGACIPLAPRSLARKYASEAPAK